MINPFVLGAIREREMQAALRRELIRMDLAGNTNYLNPQLYTAYLGGAPIPVDPVAAAEVAQAQVYAPEVYIPGLPVVPGTYVPQVPMQDPRQLAMAGLRDSASAEGYAFNLQRQELLRRINERLDAVRAAEAAQLAAEMQAQMLAADKDSAISDTSPYIDPLKLGLAVGAASAAGAAAAGGGSVFSRLGRGAVAGAVGGGAAAFAAYRLRETEKERYRKLREAERSGNRVLAGIGLGGLTGAGLGYAFDGSLSGLRTGAALGAAAGGLTGYGYSQLMNGISNM
jgi:hypothetical protein